MVWFLKKPKTTEPEMGGKISRIEIYSVHDPTLPKYLKELKKDLENYTKISGIKLESFDGTAKQLGTFCGKPFSIASLAIVK